jgi:tetratricopeptide (TPR) repeat protein
VLGLQASISQDISEQIARMIGGYSGARAQPPPIFSQKEYEAYELYLKGRFFLSKRTPEGFTQAAQYFREAIAKAPENPRPYAALADAYVLMSAYDLVPPGQVIPEARAAAQHALELDDRLAEAHTTLALIAQNYHWDWETAEREFRKAIELDPNYATAHHWYAEHLALENRFEEAFGEIERARQLDPMSLIINTDYGAMLYFSRTYDRAIEQFRTVMEMEPNFPRARILALVYVQRGKFAEAIAQVESWRRTTGDEWSWASSAYVYGRSGSPAKAKKAVAVLKRRHGKVNPIAMCVAEIGLNHKDEALAWLEKAYAMHAGPLTALKVDPVYDPLRGDPRFAKLLERIGLATQPGVSQGIVSEKISPSFTKP